jgi:N-acetyl-anhydromuramyl-L-alanine amidase AmpD
VLWVASPNYWAGRPVPPVALVLHTMDGTLAGSDSWFANPGSRVSAHFGIGRTVQAIHQYVRLGDRAWANGVLEAGNRWAPTFGPGNPNDRTVSIETEDGGDIHAAVTDVQYADTVQAARLALDAYPSLTHLVAHRAISPSSRVNCPGPRWLETGLFSKLARELGLLELT